MGMLRNCLTAGAFVAVAAAAAGSADAAAFLSKHVPAAVSEHRAALAGPLSPDTSLKFNVALPMRHTDDLAALVRQIYDPANPQYRHYLSVAEFTRHFGPTESDYGNAVAFFHKSGLTVRSTSPNRYLISLEGRAADIDRVFHVKLNLYQHPTQPRTFFAPDREPTVDLNVPLLHVTGLDNYVLPHPKFLVQTANTNPRSGGSGPGGNFIGSDFRAAYYGNGELNGKGQSVGLMELEGYIPSDISLYFTTVKQKSKVPVNGISVDGTPVNCGNCDDGEQILDIVYAISMAPKLKQVQVYVGGDPTEIENQMATDNTSKQLSTSWGYRENFAVEDAIYQEMAVQGQSYMTASGDDSSLQASGPWPEEDANITGVGGTDLVTNGAGGSYKSETGWKDSAGGPSLDQKILIESYQLPFINRKNGGSKTLRNVPDISANSDFDMLICAQGKCQGGWGGTSFASPMWAGFIALANQQALMQGKPEAGFLNPTLYNLSIAGSYKTIFHDVIGGQSGKFKAVKSYDLVTGLGSPKGQAMIDALTQ
jgi:xanthomonalisin